MLLSQYNWILIKFEKKNRNVSNNYYFIKIILYNKLNSNSVVFSPLRIYYTNFCVNCNIVVIIAIPYYQYVFLYIKSYFM